MSEKKEFKAGAYAVFAGVFCAVVLVIITIFAFTTRYTAFSPEKVAQSYVDTVVQTGDGYNACKNTLISKNQKFGNYVINAYMRPYVNDGKDVKQADFVGTGNKEEEAALDKVYDTMYDYYTELIKTETYDNIDSIFDKYFSKLAQVRKEVYKDEYMSTDYMFSCFESNVSKYGQSLTGTKKQLANDNKTVIQKETVGEYQKMFGKDYKFVTTVKSCNELSADEVKTYVSEYKERIQPLAASGEKRADEFGLKDVDKKHTYKSDMKSAFEKLDCSADISSVAKAVVEVKCGDKTVATQQVYVVKIGNSWYVDNTNIDTTGLYLSL